MPSTFRRLVCNIRLNNLSSAVRALNVGLGSRGGSLTFTTNLDTQNRPLAKGEAASGSTVEVPVMTVDEVASSRVPEVIKIDVEGFETAVLSGASQTLARHELKALIVECNRSGARYGADERALHRRIEGFGFRRFAYDPFGRKLTAAPTTMTKANALYVRDVERVQHRLRSASAFSVIGMNV